MQSIGFPASFSLDYGGAFAISGIKGAAPGTAKFTYRAKNNPGYVSLTDCLPKSKIILIIYLELL